MRVSVERAMQVCPVEVAVSVLGGAWKLTLVKYLLERPHRFGELGRRVPTANTKTVTRQLRELEQDGIVRRRVFDQVPPKVEYSLTERGLSLEPLVMLMNDWGTTFTAQRE